MVFGINPEMESLLKNEEADNVNSGNGTVDKTGESNNNDLDNPDDKSGEGANDNPEIDKDPGKGNPDDKGADKNTPEPEDKTHVPVEPTEEQVVEFLKSKGGKFEKLEDLFAEKQVAENPYASIIEDPEVKSFLDFKKYTGRSFSDYQKLQENINDISLYDLAIAKTKAEFGDLTDEEIIAFIEEEINVDLSELDELTPVEKAKLTKYTKDYKANLLAEQEKYKTPLSKENPADEVEMITLENGQKVPKSIYEDHQKKHQAYQEDIRVAVDSVAKTSLNVEFDNAGKKETFSFDYEYDAEDKKNMISLTADIDKTIASLFRTEKGFDYAGFAKAVSRLDPKNWEKEVGAIVNKAIAETTLRLQQNENNIDFNRNKLPNSGGSSTKDIFSKPNGFGMTFEI